MLRDTEQYITLLGDRIRDRNVLELGCGSGVLTRLLLDAGAGKVLGYEIDPTLCQVHDPRFELLISDYTDIQIDTLRNYCLVANPAYTTLDAIIKAVLPFVSDVILMVPEDRLSEFYALGFRKQFELSGSAFDPPATGRHCVVLRGFDSLFVDLHHVCSLIDAETIPARVLEIAARLPSAAICAVGGIPIREVDKTPHWCDKPISASLLSGYIRDALGLSAVLTYTNKKHLSLQDLGAICLSRNEKWSYHWFTLTLVLAGQPGEVQISFARDSRFRLGWTVEKQYTGAVFTASASLHDWIKFTSKREDASFDSATRAALQACFNVLSGVLP